MELLNGISMFGFGRWNDISKLIGTRTAAGNVFPSIPYNVVI